MKAALIGLIAVLAALAVARADLIIVQKVEGAGQAGEQTIRIKGDKARSDLAQSVSMITDGASGEMTTLMHNGKTFLKVSAAQAQAMMEQLQNSAPAASLRNFSPPEKWKRSVSTNAKSSPRISGR